MNRSLKSIVGILLVGMLSTSCVTDPNFVVYVKAHRLAYDARKDTYIKLVDASALSPLEKDTIKSKEKAEDDAITSAEVYLGIKK